MSDRPAEQELLERADIGGARALFFVSACAIGCMIIELSGLAGLARVHCSVRQLPDHIVVEPGRQPRNLILALPSPP